MSWFNGIVEYSRAACHSCDGASTKSRVSPTSVKRSRPLTAPVRLRSEDRARAGLRSQTPARMQPSRSKVTWLSAAAMSPVVWVSASAWLSESSTWLRWDSSRERRASSAATSRSPRWDSSVEQASARSRSTASSWSVQSWGSWRMAHSEPMTSPEWSVMGWPA